MFQQYFVLVNHEGSVHFYKHEDIKSASFVIKEISSEDHE